MEKSLTKFHFPLAESVSHAIFHPPVSTEHEHLSLEALWCSTGPCPDGREGGRTEQETSAQPCFVTRDVGSSPGHSRDAINSKQRKKLGLDQECPKITAVMKEKEVQFHFLFPHWPWSFIKCV